MARETQRRFENGKLVYYAATADGEYWDGEWATRLSPKVYRLAEQGRHRYLQRLYDRYLPKDGLIVEAGCGRAQITLGLQRAGYRVEGVDFAPETLDRVRAMYPELTLRVADVTRMDVPDGHYAGYISIGVIEHRREGSGPFLDEAFRILRPGGIAIFTVPYLNPIRRRMARRGAFDGPAPTLPFYQYAYDREGLERELAAAGFEVLDAQVYAGYQGVTDEWPWAKRWIKWLRKLPWAGKRFSRWLDHGPYGHMIAAVARKPVPPGR
ncbi:MAG TPA: class I SAM-dependent methyltransferase [Nevskiaceae bacterium]|nr:class I SAM-dependent methyltransferase [Nevskiaceae bacterium]